jgi:hypothetical protein
MQPDFYFNRSGADDRLGRSLDVERHNQTRLIRHITTYCSLLGILFLTSSGFGSAPPMWENETALRANEGHVLLSWEPTGKDSEYEIQYTGPGGESEIRYRGPDLAYFATGLAEGKHAYRVRESGGPWSRPVEVTVNYPPISHVLIGLVSGALLLGITMGTIAAGYRLCRTEGESGVAR